jgi:hypothetical protein
MEISQWEYWNHLFCRKVSFLTDPHCRFRGVGQGVNQTYLMFHKISPHWLSRNYTYCKHTSHVEYTYLFCLVDVFFESFNFTFRYIDDVLSINNSRLGDFVDRIYLIELEIKDTTDTARTVSYIDLHLDLTVRTGKERNFTIKERISIFPLWTSIDMLYVATFQQHLHMEYISMIVLPFGGYFQWYKCVALSFLQT